MELEIRRHHNLLHHYTFQFSVKGSMEPPKELPPWRKQPLATIEKNPVDPMDKQISGQALDDKGVSKPLKEFQNVCNSLNSCKNAWEKELAKAQDLACRLEIKGDPSFHAKGKGLQTWCQEQLKAIANLRSYVEASEDLAPEDTSPESLSKSLPAAKAWLASSQEKLQEAKAKVKTHQALL